MAPPAPVEERGLVDDVGAAAHGRERGRLRLGQLVRLLAGQAEAHDGPPVGLEPLELTPLVLVALAAQQLEGGIVSSGRVGLAGRDPSLLLRQMTAGEEGREVARAEDQRVVGGSVHPCEYGEGV